MRRFISIVIASLLATSTLSSCSGNSDLPFNQGFVPTCKEIDTTRISSNELLLDCLDGAGAINFHTIKGPVVVNVWGSWCEGCRQETPYFIELYDSELIKNSEIELLGVNVDESNRQSGINFIKKYGIKWPHLEDSEGKTKNLFGPGVPVTWFIDESGLLAGKHIGAYSSSALLFSDVRKYFNLNSKR